MDPLVVAWIINTVLVVVLTLALGGLHIHNAQLNTDMKRLDQQYGHVLVQLQSLAEGDGLVIPVTDRDANSSNATGIVHEHH